MSCLGCQNPEGQRGGRELLFRPDRCTACGDCVPVCPQEALCLEDGELRVDRDRCDLSGACVKVCLPGALEFSGWRAEVDELVDVLERDRIYYDESGGGVTLSGGEPLGQPEFARELLEACRERDIPTVLDTCGYAPPEVFRELASLASRLLVDLKLLDSERHAAFTGVGNGWILKNIVWLASSGIPFAVRLPLIPGVNDDDENLQATGAFLSALESPPPVDILPYHRFGVGKYARLGLSYKLAEVQTPSEDGVREAVDRLRGFGLRVLVRGDKHGDV